VLLGLRRWVHKNGGHVHAALVDLQSQTVLASHRVSEPTNPASNMKVLTAAAALDLLGPNHGFRTELFGAIGPDGNAPRLVLRGGGDPGLSTSDLSRLARAARSQGLVQLGAVACDQSRFDAGFVPPGFEQQPGEWAPFRAPISALAVDRNAVALNVQPGKAGSAARVWYEPPGVVVSRGKVRTSEPGSGDRVTWSLDPKTDPRRPSSVLGGALGEDLGRRRYSRRLDDPRLAGCYALRALLLELGVEGELAVSLASGGESPGPRLTYLASAPLAELLKPLGKESDNFSAEMVLVALSQADGRPEELAWSSSRGAARLLRWLKDGGVPTAGVVIKNGSGLFDANRLTAEVLALTLARMERRREVYPEFLSQLSVYGTDGTLRRRMREHPARSRIRAKTGTLRDVDALSGYILRASGQRPLAFSLVVTDCKASHSATRAQLDKTAFGWLAKVADVPPLVEGAPKTPPPAIPPAAAAAAAE
jgi:D-alanyl-D-alanine carboxypeptidase/D-alanyl-D-alanine-endopeptidase (penicillin-binding protein 4)